MSLPAAMLRPDALRSGDEGLELEVRLPWYRSLALSCVEDLELWIGGEPVSSSELRLVVNEQERSLGDLESLDDETWFVRDPVVLRLARTVDPGEEVDVRVTLRLRIPYIVTGPDTPLTQTTERSARLVVGPPPPHVPSLVAGQPRADRTLPAR